MNFFYKGKLTFLPKSYKLRKIEPTIMKPYKTKRILLTFSQCTVISIWLRSIPNSFDLFSPIDKSAHQFSFDRPQHVLRVNIWEESDVKNVLRNIFLLLSIPSTTFFTLKKLPIHRESCWYSPKYKRLISRLAGVGKKKLLCREILCN